MNTKHNAMWVRIISIMFFIGSVIILIQIPHLKSAAETLEHTKDDKLPGLNMLGSISIYIEIGIMKLKAVLGAVAGLFGFISSFGKKCKTAAIIFTVLNFIFDCLLRAAPVLAVFDTVISTVFIIFLVMAISTEKNKRGISYETEK